MAQKIAYIREAECIGCIKCIKACSDQAILGARKQMHTIITDLCTGCEDCVAVCPVDCIEMVLSSSIVSSGLRPASPTVVGEANHRADEAHFVQAPESSQAKKDLIAQAMARTLARRAWKQGHSNDSTEMPRDL